MRRDLRVDVTDAVGSGERLAVAATVVAPDEPPSKPRVAFFGFPGGGYNRHYYDLQLAGYSQAEYHAGHGHVFVSVDHLGVGESDLPARPLDFEAVALANAHAATEILSGLDGVEAAVAIGQSYGGFLLIIGQSIAPVFDGVAILGYSAVRALAPWPDDVTLDDVLALRAGNGLDHPMRRVFHRADVPDDIVVADMTKAPGTLLSDAPWSTRYMPGGPAVTPTRNPRDPGVVAVEAASIDVPVLVANGEVDVVGDPWTEPTAYHGSPHVTVAVVPRMAHMHNFASSRRELWDVVEDWALSGPVRSPRPR